MRDVSIQFIELFDLSRSPEEWQGMCWNRPEYFIGLLGSFHVIHLFEIKGETVETINLLNITCR